MDQMQISSLSFHLSPLLPIEWLVFISLFGMLLAAVSGRQRKRGTFVRVLCFCAFLTALLNPSLLREDRHFANDTAIIVVDQSGSQNFGNRLERTQRALDTVEKQLRAEKNLDVQILKAPNDAHLSHETRLFESLDLALANIPVQRRAGVIFITDGQIHDVPEDKSTLEKYGPIHGLLSGDLNEKDRQIVITNAPAYGLVEQDITVKFKIEDTINIGENQAEVTLTQHNGEKISYFVKIDEEQSIKIPILHPSQNIFTLEVEGVDGEITLANNKVPVVINGVRDRLKVLLVSGKPHAGARTWRDLLTSDPGVDLVHFTILREPQKIDYTPQNELSLIAFPFDELFNVKLYDFDLIVFDQYRSNNILPPHYFENIARYVEEGGAFLEASGADFADNKYSLYNTPLSSILPAEPTGEVFHEKFKPTLTELGRKHPVTSSLIWNNKDNSTEENPSWGNWLQYTDITVQKGDVLMNAVANKPLLVLNRVGKGRVAQLSSDQVWLWARGYDGGGPHAELLRRTVHWLMKEPELDERALDVQVHKNSISVRKQNLGKGNEAIAVSDPLDDNFSLELKDNGKGWLTADIEAKSLGVYSFEDTSGNRKFAIIGNVNPLELRSVVMTDEKLKPAFEASGGGAVKLVKTPDPKIRFLGESRSYAGNNWVALRRNNDYTVTGVQDTPLMPKWAILLGLLLMTAFMWWYEGQKK